MCAYLVISAHTERHTETQTNRLSFIQSNSPSSHPISETCAYTYADKDRLLDSVTNVSTHAHTCAVVGGKFKKC